MRPGEEVNDSSGNVFADLDLPDADERLQKAPLALAILRAIRASNITQEEAARRMGVKQPDVSNIVRGRLDGFTLDRLVRCLNALDRDVEIVIREKPEGAPRGRIVVRDGQPQLPPRVVPA